MAHSLYIEEFSDFGVAGTLSDMVNITPSIPITTQAIVYTTHAESAAFNIKTLWVRVSSAAAASLRFGASPTAVATDPRLPPNTDRFYAVIPGQKVSVIDNTDS